MEEKNKRIKIIVTFVIVVILIAIVVIVFSNRDNTKEETNRIENNQIVMENGNNGVTEGQENKNLGPKDSTVKDNPSSSISTPTEEENDKVSGSSATE